MSAPPPDEVFNFPRLPSVHHWLFLRAPTTLKPFVYVALQNIGSSAGKVRGDCLAQVRTQLREEVVLGDST
jgi:hypothetical protein